MHDAVALEGRGIPTAVILTDAFLHEADVQLTALGAERLEPVVIAHPLSTLTADEITRRAAEGSARRRAHSDERTVIVRRRPRSATATVRAVRAARHLLRGHGRSIIPA